MSDKLNIEQLISSKLGEAEVNPAKGSWSGIQRKLRWRQFMRFNPVKLNIFYLGGLLVAGAGLFAILNTDQSESGSPGDPGHTVDPGLTGDPGSLQNNGSMGETSPSVSGRNKIITSREAALAQENAASEQHDVVSGEIRAESQDRKPKGVVSQGNAEPVSDPEGSVAEEFGIIPDDQSSTGHIRELPVQNTLVPYFTCSVQSGCAPLSVQFFNQSLNETSFHWSFGADENMLDQDPVYKFTEPGKYKVTLTSENAEGQIATFNQIIEVYPSPTAAFEIEDGIESPGGFGNLDLINYSVGAFSYAWNLVGESDADNHSWSSSKFQPSIQLPDLDRGTRYLSLVATNEDGCTDSAIQIIPNYPGSFTPTLRFPTAFSPNPNGPVGGHYSPHEKRIDLFYPVFITVPREYSLRIFTRTGEQIFESYDIFRGWDGYYLQEHSTGGVYVWVAEGTWENGEEFKIQGDVTLIWSDQR